MVDLGKIYCIHRKEDKERGVKLLDQVTPLGLFFDVVEPETPRDDIEYISRMNSRKNSLRETTIKLIENAIENNLPRITIMEDDCVFFKEGWDKFITSTLPDDFHLVHLNITGRQSYGVYMKNEIYRQLHFGECCQFYIIDSSVYEIYLKLLKENIVPIDEITCKIHYKYGKSYCVEPFPVKHEPGLYSTLNDEIVEY